MPVWRAVARSDQTVKVFAHVNYEWRSVRIQLRRLVSMPWDKLDLELLVNICTGIANVEIICSAASVVDGGKLNKPPTFGKRLTNLLTHFQRGNCSLYIELVGNIISPGPISAASIKESNSYNSSELWICM